MAPEDLKEEKKMHCTKCGRENNDGAKFCQNCGAALQTTGQVSASPKARTDKRIVGIAGLIAGVVALV